MGAFSYFAAQDSQDVIDREQKWHREIYNMEHSPLAGEVGASLHPHTQYLPTLKHPETMIWKSDNLNVLDHTLSNYDFTPRYQHNRRFEAIRILEKLPSELRLMVYRALIHTWEKEYPETRYGDPDAKVGMARRNLFPIYGPNIDTLVQTCSEICHNQPKFEEKYGMLDYFKDAEWENIKGSVKTMRDFQNYRGQPTGTLSRKNLEGAVDVLEDFMDYFWDQTVLDVRFQLRHMQPNFEAYFLPKPIALYRFPFQERILHSRIRHITLEADPGEVASDWLLCYTMQSRLPPDEKWVPDVETFLYRRGRPSPFIQRCKFVTAHLPNLRTASIYITMYAGTLEQTDVYEEIHPNDPNAFRKSFKAAMPWTRTVANIPVKEKLDIMLRLVPGPRYESLSCVDYFTCDAYHRASECVAEQLRNVYSSKYAGRFDGDPYHGLDELFQEV